MKHIGLLLVSILIGIFLAEVSIRLVVPWLSMDMSKRGSWLVLSQRGYTLNKDYGSSIHEFGPNKATYHFYPYHLRDTIIHKQSKPILILGDSFTFGWLLPWAKTYVYQLQQYADRDLSKSPIQFLNAATAGWGTADQLAYLEEFGKSLSPKYVLIFINTDDIGRSIKRENYKLMDQRSLKLIDNFHPSAYTRVLKAILATPVFNWMIEHLLIVQFVRLNLPTFFVIDKGTINANNLQPQQTNPAAVHDHIFIPMSPELTYKDNFSVKYAEALFLRINQWCKKNNAKLLVVTTGYNEYYPADNRDPTKLFFAQSHAFFKREHIPYYDIARKFKQATAGKPIQTENDGHPNAFAAQVIAQISWPWIKQQIETSHG